MAEFQLLLRDALVAAAVLIVPVLALATLVGALIAILQAATQVQEQTLTLLPKVIAVGAALAAFGPFGMQVCEALFREAIAGIPALVRGG